MNKVTMKLALSLLSLLICFGMMAQQGANKERKAKILEKKKIYCNEEVGLTDSEAKNYWAIDAELMEKKKALFKEVKGVRELDLESASDAEIKAVIKARLDAQLTVAQLDLDYLDRFLEVITPEQLALMKKAEHSFKKNMLRDLKDSGRSGPPERMKN